jgi:aminopeptidase
VIIMTLQEKLNQNIKSILDNCFQINTDTQTIVIYDEDTELAKLLTLSYKHFFGEKARFYNFKELSKAKVLAIFNDLSNVPPLERGLGGVSHDLVILVQSSNFRLDDFRIRLHLFNQGLQVIEHMHLHRNDEESQIETYINSLEYNVDYYQNFAYKIGKEITESKMLELISGDGAAILTINGVEPVKYNNGDYTKLGNKGGTFPIGEIFTEARNFEDMNGTVFIKAFADVNFDVQIVKKSFWIKIEKGIIVETDPTAPDDFLIVLNKIKTAETLLVREIGFGLNRAISFEKPLGDITAFERMSGVHLSLGHKHSVYKKAGFPAHKARFHVDIFVDIDYIKVQQTTPLLSWK